MIVGGWGFCFVLVVVVVGGVVSSSFPRIWEKGLIIHLLPVLLFFKWRSASFITTCHASWRIGSNEGPQPLSVSGKPLDGAPAVVHFLDFNSHSSSQVVFS